MNYIPKNIQGIEGDDIPYHLGLLGEDVDNLPKDVYFYTLTDHYNVHDAEWKKSAEECATKSRAVVFYDLVVSDDFCFARSLQRVLQWRRTFPKVG